MKLHRLLIPQPKPWLIFYESSAICGIYSFTMTHIASLKRLFNAYYIFGVSTRRQRRFSLLNRIQKSIESSSTNLNEFPWILVPIRLAVSLTVFSVFNIRFWYSVTSIDAVPFLYGTLMTTKPSGKSIIVVPLLEVFNEKSFLLFITVTRVVLVNACCKVPRLITTILHLTRSSDMRNSNAFSSYT